MHPTRSLSIVIPVYEEELRLPATIDELERFASADDSVLEVVFVNDGSRDGTLRIARAARARNPLFRVVDYFPNAGKGYAIRRGVIAARGDDILISDADLSTPIDEVRRLRPLLDEADVVIGSRAVDESTVRVRQPWYRRAMGKTFNRIMRLVTGLPFLDTQCGFKLVRRSAARRIFSEAVVDRFAFDVEMLMIARALGMTIREIPVEWLNSPNSRVRIVRDSSRMLYDIIAMRLRIGRARGGGR